MLVYLSVMLIVTVFSILAQLKITKYNNNFQSNEKTYNSIFICLIFLTLGLVAGLRWRVGTDYWQYSSNYYTYKEIDWNNLSLLDEPGIRIIAKISSIIYDDYAVMFLFASLLTIYLIGKTISDNTPMLTFSILLFILTGAWHGTFNGVRQYIAAAIIFSGHKYIVQKKFIKYIMIVSIASLFHISAVTCVLFYFIPTKKIKIKHMILMLTFVVIFITSYSRLVDVASFLKNETIPLNSYVLREVSIFRVLTKIAPVIFYILFTKKQGLTQKENFYINTMFVNAAIVIATSNSAYLSRLWIYTDLFSVLFYPILMENLKDKRLKTISAFLILIFYFIYWAYEVFSTRNLYNFNWIFEREFL